MKKLFVLLLALLMIGTAVAEGSLPIQNYLIGRGYTVMDEAQLAAMGGEASGDDSELAEFGNLIILSADADTTPAIIYTMDGTMYLAIDMMGMFSGSTDVGGITSVFTDTCQQYEFDAYMATTTTGQYCYTPSLGLIAQIEARAGDDPYEMSDSLDDFIAAVKAQ